MAISDVSDSSVTDRTTPLMSDIVDGFVDYKGNPVHRSNSGGWRSASFIIAVEMGERFAFYGISMNLISYLTESLGQSTAIAAENVNTWSGTATVLPLLGAFVADSFLGRYRTVIAASLIYILGLGLLTLSATLISLDASNCHNTINLVSCHSPQLLVILFFVALYLVAVGQGGHKPCVQAFGADQFDSRDPKENKAKGSFFNWWYFSTAVSVNVELLVLVYIQDNLSWSFGFGIPCMMMSVALLVFLLGSRTYRYAIKSNGQSPFIRIGRVIVRAARNWRTTSTRASIEEVHCDQLSKKFRFLDKALLAPDCSVEGQKVCSITDVEETKALLKLIPIWTTSLGYAIVFAQTSTLFTKQGVTMDRTIFPGFQLPAASLQLFIGFAIIVFVPIYDRIFVPLARTITAKPSGITVLQRMGTGMLISALSMVVAALVEMKRLATAEEYGMVDQPNATIPMSVMWLVPQYLLCGLADVFTIVGLQEFFYDQVPKELRSMGLSFYLSVLGVGSFLSSFLISMVVRLTGGDGGESWISSNLNRAHLDYFYWLLAGLSVVAFSAYLYFARSYIYTRETRS